MEQLTGVSAAAALGAPFRSQLHEPANDDVVAKVRAENMKLLALSFQ